MEASRWDVRVDSVSVAEGGGEIQYDAKGDRSTAAWDKIWSLDRDNQMGGNPFRPDVVGFNYTILLRNGKMLKLRHDLPSVGAFIEQVAHKVARKSHSVDQFVAPVRFPCKDFEVPFCPPVCTDFAADVIERDSNLADCRRCPSCKCTERSVAPEYPCSTETDVVVCDKCGIRYRYVTLSSVLVRLAGSTICAVVAGVILANRDPVRGLSGGATIILALMTLLSVGFLAWAVLLMKRIIQARATEDA